MNSGSEAVEHAIRVARYITNRDAVVTFDHAYHGAHTLASALSAAVMPWKHGFGVSAEPIFRVPFAYPFRCAMGRDPESCGLPCASYAIDQMTRTIGPDNIACVIAEPVQGVGGGIVPAPEFLPKIREFCRQHRILFLADEAQTAFGRTGYWFGMEHFGIVRDIIATAKALGGGLPIGAVTASAALLSKVHVGGLGSTFGGNPIACAASLAILDEISSKGLVDRAARVGGEIRQKLLTVQRELPLLATFED